MRGRLLCFALLFALAANAVAAQRQFSREWFRVAPEDEEFAVLFPEVNFRIRRELPFGPKVTLKPASFEISNSGTSFSVVSFSKSEAGTPKTLEEFAKGFGVALSKNVGGARAEMRFERESKLDGRAFRQFRMKVGDASGSARIYETAEHFYVVMSLGEQGASGAGERFHDSFSLDKSAPARVPMSETVDVLTSPTPDAPAPFWPVAGGAHGYLIGAASRSAEPAPDMDTSSLRGRPLISGGVLDIHAVKPSPVYPPIAKAARASGKVVVQIVVDEEGYVISAQAVSGHPLLQQAAAVAARQARFAPTLLDGQPVKVSGVITYNFVLQ